MYVSCFIPYRSADSLVCSSESEAFLYRHTVPRKAFCRCCGKQVLIKYWCLGSLELGFDPRIHPVRALKQGSLKMVVDFPEHSHTPFSFSIHCPLNIYITTYVTMTCQHFPGLHFDVCVVLGGKKGVRFALESKNKIMEQFFSADLKSDYNDYNL